MHFCIIRYVYTDVEPAALEYETAAEARAAMQGAVMSNSDEVLEIDTVEADSTDEAIEKVKLLRPT